MQIATSIASDFISWASYELASYGFALWLLFVAVVWIASWLGRGPGALVGHVIVAALVFASDVLWIRTEMIRPGRDPGTGPDQDAIFFIGMVLRVLLVSIVLLPISLLAVRFLRPQVLTDAANASPGSDPSPSPSPVPEEGDMR